MFFSRSKRATSVPTGDIEIFQKNGEEYLRFIEQLKGALTQSNVNYGRIRLTKADNGVTKVVLKNGDTQVPFIYRNNDLYIIGWLVGNQFWVDGEVFRELRLVGEKLPRGHAWIGVIGANTAVKSLSVPLSYNNILQGNKVKINRMGDSLEKLNEVTDQNKRSGVVREHLVPFVVAFSEAIRFPAVAQAVKSAFVNKKDGEINMTTSVLELTGVGHPDARRKPTAFNIKWLTLNWGRLSNMVKTCYVDNISTGPIKNCDESLGLEKSQLNLLLGVASSGALSASRGKRDTSHWIGGSMPSEEFTTPKLHLIPNDDIRESYESSSSYQQLLEPTRQLDTIGGLHLITMGILYLSGRKFPTLTFDNQMDSYEAQAIAAELVEKINCVTEMDLGYEDNMHMQKELAAVLTRGGAVDDRIASLIGEQFENRVDREELIDEAMKGVLREITENNAVDQKICFPEING